MKRYVLYHKYRDEDWKLWGGYEDPDNWWDAWTFDTLDGANEEALAYSNPCNLMHVDCIEGDPCGS